MFWPIFLGHLQVTRNVQGEHKVFPDYKHLLQENYVEHKHIFFYHYLS